MYRERKRERENGAHDDPSRVNKNRDQGSEAKEVKLAALTITGTTSHSSHLSL